MCNPLTTEGDSYIIQTTGQPRANYYCQTQDTRLHPKMNMTAAWWQRYKCPFVSCFWKWDSFLDFRIISSFKTWLNLEVICKCWLLRRRRSGGEAKNKRLVSGDQVSSNWDVRQVFAFSFIALVSVNTALLCLPWCYNKKILCSLTHLFLFFTFPWGLGESSSF